MVEHCLSARVFSLSLLGSGSFSAVITFQPEMLHGIMQSLYIVLFTQKPMGEEGRHYFTKRNSSCYQGWIRFDHLLTSWSYLQQSLRDTGVFVVL
jgi:hypothetical protein